MSTYHIIKDVLNENSSVVQHQIEEKHVRTVGNLFNGNSFTAIATTSTAKFDSISTSTGKRKLVVPSPSISLERKDSIQCTTPRTKIAGRNKVIELHNYADIIEQRGITTRAAVKRCKITEGQEQISVRSPTSPSGNRGNGPDVTDVDLKVVSLHCANKKTIDMHKRKLLAKANIKVKRQKNSSGMQLPNAKEISADMVDIKKIKSDLSTSTKPLLKKPKINERKRVSNIQSSKTEIKHFSRLTQTEREWKILKPCRRTLQNKKCSTELICPYLHSDFPCKYYYLSIQCPQSRKCPFMHNGPLAPRLMEALRNHILDLLSNKPSTVETYFMEQMNQVDDLYQRLLGFQNNHLETCEIIELLDDDTEHQMLIIDDNSNECSDSTLNPLQNSQNMLVIDTITDEFDTAYTNFKETINLLEGIEKKLKSLKTSSNLTSNEKIIELQKIYELLKQQEENLTVYENLNISPSTSQILTIDDDKKLFSSIESNQQNTHPNLKLVHSDIVNEIKILESQEIITTITDDESSQTKMTTTNINVLQEGGIEILRKENIHNKIDINFTTNLSYKFNNITPVDIVEDSTGGIIIILTKCDFSNDKDKISEDTKNNNNNQISENNNHSILLNMENGRVKTNEKEEKYMNSSNNRYSNETVDSVIIQNITNIIDSHILDHNHIDNNEESPPFEYISLAKSSKNQRLNESLETNCILLRSPTRQKYGGSLNQLKAQETQVQTEELTKVKKRRLKILQPKCKTIEETQNECGINAQITKKFIEPKRNKETADDIKKISKNVQDMEVPSTLNVILTKRFMNKVRAKLHKNVQLNKTKENCYNIDSDKNVEQNIFALHNHESNKNINTIESVDAILLKQISCDGRYTLNSSQDLLIGVSGFNNVEQLGNEISTLSIFNDNELVKKQAVQKEMPADSTTFNDNSNVTSNDKILNSLEYDLGSSLKVNKCIKINNAKNKRKVIYDQKKRTYLKQSDARMDDFDSDSSDKQLNIADVLEPSAISANEKVFEPSSTIIQEYVNQKDNESDLCQRIENVCNKSDLQLQTQQQQQKDDEVETIPTSFIVKSSNNLLNEHGYSKEVERDKKEEKIGNICNPYGDVEKSVKVEYEILSSSECVDETKKPTSDCSEKYCNVPVTSNVLHHEAEDIDYSKYASLCNKLPTHTTKCQINFEDSSINITPVASPTYGNDTIASPSPINRVCVYHTSGEIDGRLTYPPIPYMLYEIDLENIDINRLQHIDKLKKTVSLDPRIFRTYNKKQMMGLHKSNTQISDALVPTVSTVLSCDPRIRAPIGVMANIETSSSSNQDVQTSYNMNPTMSSYVNTDMQIPVVTPLSSNPQSVYPQVQQLTPNMVLFGCLQRSPWYQSLMSTMKIQINQSISQLVRALNNFHRERLLNPTIIFDVFKIDCVGELLEIMRNLDIFIDVNGTINEQRHLPSFGGRSCHNTMPVNATYSFIQQVLTPNTHSSSMTTTSSSYNALSDNTMDSLNVVEPFVSCYIKAPETIKRQESGDALHSLHNDDNNIKKRNYNQNERRYNHYKKPYINNYSNNKGNNNDYQQRSNHRSYYKNSRLTKFSNIQKKSSFSPPNSPRDGKDDDNSNNYSGGRHCGGGCLNNNKRFISYNSDNTDSSSWSFSHRSGGENCFSGKYQNNQSSYNSTNSPTRSSLTSSCQQCNGSPQKTVTTLNQSYKHPPIKDTEEEECWDSDK